MTDPPAAPAARSARAAPGGPRAARARGVGVAGAALFVLFALGLLPVEAVYVAEGSMAPTLRPGDRVLLVHTPFAGADRDALVALVDPQGDGLIVKRVLAVGGDRIAIEDGVVVRNGRPVVEPYADRTRIDGVYLAPRTVPRDAVWVLGDSRGDSVDSRHFGPVPASSVVGRVAVRLWPHPGGL